MRSEMPKKRYKCRGNNPQRLRRELEQPKGSSLKKAIHKGVSYQTIVRWRREYEVLKLSQANLKIKQIPKMEAVFIHYRVFFNN